MVDGEESRWRPQQANRSEVIEAEKILTFALLIDELFLSIYKLSKIEFC